MIKEVKLNGSEITKITWPPCKCEHPQMVRGITQTRHSPRQSLFAEMPATTPMYKGSNWQQMVTVEKK